MIFQQTRSDEQPSLMRIADFERWHALDDATSTRSGTTLLTALNPSLLQDLQRFDRGDADGAGIDAIEVLAAALRHGRALLIHLQIDYRVLPLTIDPVSRSLLSPLALPRLLALKLPELHVLRIQPAPADPAAGLHGAPLAPLTWELALRGAREELLPEIAGVAAYRATPGIDLASVDLGGTLGAAVARLRQQAVPLREIAAWPGFDRSRAMRLLNALYLQSALMVTRTHPGAIGG